MDAEIISIGTELLMGETVDTNSSYIGEQLARIGIDLTWATKVGDHPDRLQEAIRHAWGRSDVTITTGGLGPTSDDLTRESIAAVMGERMEVQDDLLAHLRSQFESRGIHMPETNVKQATLIPSARVIPNPMGTAPGWWIERDGRVIAALPGPPREITGMWESVVGPGLRALNPGVFIVTRTLKTFGITEGGLDEMLSPLFESENPSLGIYSKQDGIHLRAIARAESEDEARTLIGPMEAEIRRIAGHAIWGEDDDTAVTAALRTLAERSLSLAIVEGFTGGLLSSTLMESPLSRDTVVGSVVLAANGSGAKILGRRGWIRSQPDSGRRHRACFCRQGELRRGRRTLGDRAGLGAYTAVWASRNHAHRDRGRRREPCQVGVLPYPTAAHQGARRYPHAAGAYAGSGDGRGRTGVQLGVGSKRDATMNVEETEASWGLADRGIGFQAAGFAFVGCVGVAILELFSGSNFWLYGAFETAATKMHWSLIVPAGCAIRLGEKDVRDGKGNSRSQEEPDSRRGSRERARRDDRVR